MRKSRDDFFVGYLPLPPTQRRFLIATSAALVSALIVAAALLASRQRDPGPGQWLDDQTTELTGIVYEQPYPMLRTTAGDGSSRTYLVVNEGKIGAADALRGWNGRSARLRGTILQREGARLLELASAPESFESDSHAMAQAIERPSAPSRKLVATGEIIDPKCFAGAMKPGDGKPHKGCAALCLRGGIPPMFTRLDQAGRREFYLIASETADRADGELLESLIARVGQPIELRGVARQMNDVTLLCIEASQFQKDPR